MLKGTYIESNESSSESSFSAGKLAYGKSIITIKASLSNTSKELSKMIHLKLMPFSALGKITGSTPHPCEMLNFSEGKAQKVGKAGMRKILKYVTWHLFFSFFFFFLLLDLIGLTFHVDIIKLTCVESTPKERESGPPIIVLVRLGLWDAKL